MILVIISLIVYKMYVTDKKRVEKEKDKKFKRYMERHYNKKTQCSLQYEPMLYNKNASSSLR